MISEQIQSITKLDTMLSLPSEADTAFMRQLDGDILILGAAGKMGPSLAKLAKKAAEAAGGRRRIIAASRFASEDKRLQLESDGIVAVRCDLLNLSDVASLPYCENVLFLAGRKFGSSGRPDVTWAINTVAPALSAQHFRDSRIVVFSTGNIYGLQDVLREGSREQDEPAPVGEYAQSCLARERIFEYYSRENGTRCLLFRLNYATDLRYGVLVDIARKVYAGEPVDLTIPAFNIIWQRDANSYALRSIDLCASPPKILNVTGSEILSVRRTAELFANRFGRKARFQCVEGKTALLSNASQCHRLLGKPETPADTLIDWVAEWVISGREMLNKPTHFEVADGKF
jgi:nucleoside-diphosphate-sugar epimerase